MAIIETLAHLRELIPDPGPRAAAKLMPSICDQGAAFLCKAPFVMIATVGEWGLEVSQKGGAPGFIQLVDRNTVLIPEYRGNMMALGLGNMLVDPRVGIAAICPGTDEVLRVSGRATLLDDRDLCEQMSAGGKPATLIIKVAVDRAAFHCVRSARRAGMWDPSSWDEPMRISFGKIYAEGLQRPEIESEFDRLAAESDAKLY